jgi:hypothetical protein
MMNVYLDGVLLGGAGEKVGSIVYSSFPEDVELSLSHTVMDSVKAHINFFDRFCLMLSFAMPVVVLLSI